MPFYDLYCSNCDKEHNIRATMADKANRQIPCPDCGSTALDTIYNAAPAYIKSTAQPSCPSSSVCGNASCRHAS